MCMLCPLGEMSNEARGDLKEEIWIRNVIFRVFQRMPAVVVHIPKWDVTYIPEVKEVVRCVDFVKLDINSYLKS